ncbi:MAG TPA: polysaccharide deacetylase family protein [Halomicronema sp.]
MAKQNKTNSPHHRSLRWVVISILFLTGTLLFRSVAFSQQIPTPIQQHKPSQKPKKIIQFKPQIKPVSPAPQTEFFPPTQFQGKIIYQREINPQKKVIALTFDDGPWTDTPQVLKILKQNNIKATFFLVGKHLQMYPEIAKNIVEAGHAIGNHTWSHRTENSDSATAAKEIDNTSASIYKTTGAKTKLFRPPAGNLNNGLSDYAKNKNYAIILWSVDTEDWRATSSLESIVNQVLKQSTPGGIILLHDGGGNRSKTIQALPIILAELKKRNYQFVTIPELLKL